MRSLIPWSFRSLFPSLLIPFCALAFLHGAAGVSAAQLEVFVSLPPQAAIVERIGGKQVRTQIMVKAGQDPHTFEPKPRQVQDLARANIYFTSGLPFEAQIVAKIRDSKLLSIIDATAGINRVVAEDHHHPGEAEIDPHVWLSPESLKIMAENVTQALSSKDPKNRDFFRGNQQALNDELQALDEKIKAMLAPHAGRTFYVFHPAFGYFAHAYGLKQKAVETGGKSPSPKQLAALIAQAKKDGVKIIFVQPQFDARNAEVIARAINGTVVAIDPLSADILNNLVEIAAGIAKAMK